MQFTITDVVRNEKYLIDRDCFDRHRNLHMCKYEGALIPIYKLRPRTQELIRDGFHGMMLDHCFGLAPETEEDYQVRRERGLK